MSTPAENITTTQQTPQQPPMSNALATVSNNLPIEGSVFSNINFFRDAQRMAALLAESSLVPKDYQKNIANCTIALEMSQRLNISPLMVMQNLFIVNGRPSWSAQYVIASLNTCGRFSPLRFRLKGEGATRSCTAYAIELATGETLEGPEVTWAMVDAEGWSKRNGSKWLTMPEVMFRYRSASFFGKLYAPEIMNGMQTVEEAGEIIDVTPDDQGNYAIDTGAPTVSSTNDKLKSKPATVVNESIKTEQTGQPKTVPAQTKAQVQTQVNDGAESKFTYAQISKMINMSKTQDDVDTALSLTTGLPGEQIGELKQSAAAKKAEIGE